MDTLDSRRAQVRARIAQVREALRRHGATAVLVPSSDPHISEYLPRALAGPRVAVGLHRLGRHAHRDARSSPAVGRQPLLGPGRGAARGHRHRADEDLRPPAAARYVDWLAGQRAVGRHRRASMARCSASAARSRSRRRSPRAASSCAPIVDLLDEVWKDRAGAADAAGLRARAPAPWRARRQARRGARGDDASSAPRITSSRLSTTSPG